MAHTEISFWADSTYRRTASPFFDKNYNLKCRFNRSNLVVVVVLAQADDVVSLSSSLTAGSEWWIIVVVVVIVVIAAEGWNDAAANVGGEKEVGDWICEWFLSRSFASAIVASCEKEIKKIIFALANAVE